MASKYLLHRWLASFAATAAFWFGTGLHPFWWATWLGPFFAFMAVAGMRAGLAAAAGFAFFFVGELNLWSYLSFLPPAVRLALLLIPAAAFAGCAALFNRFIRNRQFASALLAPAALWTCFEFGYAAVSPHSTFGAIAYSQSDCLVVVQLASVGGIWPIGFLLFFVGAGIALSSQGNLWPSVRRNIVVAVVVPVAATAAFGWARLDDSLSRPQVKIGLVSSDAPENMDFHSPASSVEILERYLAQVPQLARAGAEIVVLPEHLFAMRDAEPYRNAADVDRLLTAAAASNRITLVVGVDRTDSGGTMENEARLYSPSGDVTTYDKQHLLPGFERRYRPGNSFVTIRRIKSNLGLAICKDLDFPELGRGYGQRGSALLLVPAFDFVSDGWLHSRMAVIRGVESGFSVARAAKSGRLTLSDDRGRILSDAVSPSFGYATVVGECPVEAEETLYLRYGNWFAWLSCAVLLGAFVFPHVSRPIGKRPRETASAAQP